MNNTTWHIEYITLVQEPTPIFLGLLDDICGEISARFNVKNH
jgi:hypothetical protein